jgi:DNA-binding transcriptional LysR family regulator
MNISLRQIRYIQVVSECGSIQSASRELRISPSSILAAVEIAETELGARIFDRRRANGMQLTPVGERFVAEGARLLTASLEFERHVGILQVGIPSILRIGCFEPFGAIFMAEALRQLRPDEKPTEIHLFEGDQTQLVDWLSRGVVDIVVTYDLGPSFGQSVTRICKVPTHALVSKDDPLASKDRISLVELAERPLVLLDLPQTSTYLLTLFDLVGVKPRVGFRTRSYETVRSAVAAGFGSATLNMRPIGRSNPDSPVLVRIPLLDDLPAPTLLIADLYGTMKPRGIQRLIDIFVSLFRNCDPNDFAVVTPERKHILFDV